jgi:SAM-dependent methyltransferase
VLEGALFRTTASADDILRRRYGIALSNLTDRDQWLLSLRRRQEQLQDALLATTDYDANWGEVEDTHRRFVERFLSVLPPHGTVLDAACGTGKYFPLILESGRSAVGVDQSEGMIRAARAKFPDVPTDQRDLQDLPYRGRFDGVMCVDAMEGIPPEDWPVVLDRFRGALRPGGWMYLTVELIGDDAPETIDEKARDAGHPVVEGERLLEPDGYYHFYPTVEWVRARLADAEFVIEGEAEGPWHGEGYAYHHVLTRLRVQAG